MSAYFIQCILSDIFFNMKWHTKWENKQKTDTRKFFFNIPKPSVPHHYNNLHLNIHTIKQWIVPYDTLIHIVPYVIWLSFECMYFICTKPFDFFIFTMMVFFYSFHHNVFVLNLYVNFYVYSLNFNFLINI